MSEWRVIKTRKWDGFIKGMQDGIQSYRDNQEKDLQREMLYTKRENGDLHRFGKRRGGEEKERENRLNKQQ